MVVFGTSGHRGSSLDGAFNDAHIAATTQAIVEYRTCQGIDGPLFIGKDTHALSMPAWTTAIEVLCANDVEVIAEHDDEWTPTPAVSRAIIVHNRLSEGRQADGIVVTPHTTRHAMADSNTTRPHGGPADTDATGWIADRANELLADPSGIRRKPYEQVRNEVSRYDYRSAYCDDLRNAIDLDAIDEAGVHIGADPLGGASVQYWEYIADHLGIDLTVVNPTVDPTWRFMTLDSDGKIRMDCSSPSAMASLIANKDAYDIATGNDADSDRHGIVTPDAGLMNPNAYLAVAIGYLFAHRPGWRPDAGIGKTLVSSSSSIKWRLTWDVVSLKYQWVSSGSFLASCAGISVLVARNQPERRSLISTARRGPRIRTASCWPCSLVRLKLLLAAPRPSITPI